jgi:peptidoglycan/LPS O-acetylase OafA/YrhL
MKYINQLNFLRFLAAIFVVFFHFGPFTGSFFSIIESTCSYVVSFFFFLSGMVLSYQYYHQKDIKFKDFWIKRFARVYPIYLIALLLTILFGLVFIDSHPKGISIILQVLAIQSWVPGKTLGVNFTGWSVSVELFFYFLFPFIANWFNKKPLNKLVIFSIIFWIFSSCVAIFLATKLTVIPDRWFYQLVVHFPLFNLNGFLMGIVCGQFIRNKMLQKKQFNYWTARLLYVLGFILLIFLLYGNRSISGITSTGLLAPLFFLIIAGLSLDKSLVTKMLGNKFLVLLGDSSYSFYILQWPIFILFMAYYNSDELQLKEFSYYFLTLTTISVLSFLYVEQRLKKKILDFYYKKKGV